MESQQTLLVGLAHPDDEVGMAGTILAHRARGGRVVIVWLTAGEMTEAFGPVPPEEVAALRREQGAEAAAILGAEHRFLDLPDTGLVASPDTAARVARILAEVQPDALLTWGDGWSRGMRHPDHQAAGKIFRDAVTLARIAKRVAPLAPHRAPVPVFTYRGEHSLLPAVAVDVEPFLEGIRRLGSFYYERIRFGHPDWLERRLRRGGEPFGLRFAEVFDAWETRPGVVASLLPAALSDDEPRHPDREDGPSGA
jgi:N-acetylglucosamine malate deacetylase 1